MENYTKAMNLLQYQNTSVIEIHVLTSFGFKARLKEFGEDVKYTMMKELRKILAQKIFEVAAALGTLPTDTTILHLKKEIQKYF